MDMQGVIWLRTEFGEGENPLLYSFVPSNSIIQPSQLTNISRVLLASNGVSKHLGSRPARCLYFDVLPQGGSAAAECTAAFIDCGRTLLILLLQGTVDEQEASDSVCRLFDLFVTVLGPGCIRDDDSVWRPHGHAPAGRDGVGGPGTAQSQAVVERDRLLMTLCLAVRDDGRAVRRLCGVSASARGSFAFESISNGYHEGRSRRGSTANGTGRGSPAKRRLSLVRAQTSPNTASDEQLPTSPVTKAFSKAGVDPATAWMSGVRRALGELHTCAESALQAHGKGCGLVPTACALAVSGTHTEHHDDHKPATLLAHWSEAPGHLDVLTAVLLACSDHDVPQGEAVFEQVRAHTWTTRGATGAVSGLYGQQFSPQANKRLLHRLDGRSLLSCGITLGIDGIDSKGGSVESASASNSGGSGHEAANATGGRPNTSNGLAAAGPNATHTTINVWLESTVYRDPGNDSPYREDIYRSRSRSPDGHSVSPGSYTGAVARGAGFGQTQAATQHGTTATNEMHVNITSAGYGSVSQPSSPGRLSPTSRFAARLGDRRPSGSWRQPTEARAWTPLTLVSPSHAMALNGLISMPAPLELVEHGLEAAHAPSFVIVSSIRLAESVRVEAEQAEPGSGPATAAAATGLKNNVDEAPSLLALILVTRDTSLEHGGSSSAGPTSSSSPSSTSPGGQSGLAHDARSPGAGHTPSSPATLLPTSVPVGARLALSRRCAEILHTVGSQSLTPLIVKALVE